MADEIEFSLKKKEFLFLSYNELITKIHVYGQVLIEVTNRKCGKIANEFSFCPFSISSCQTYNNAS